jgi:FkbM family methyltransferase
MNDGTDSAMYLAQGYRVVAVEANPVLVGQAAGRFVDNVMNGTLSLLNVGVIADNQLNGRFGPALPFFVHKTENVWSSMVERWGCRSANASAPPSLANCNKIHIPTTSCAEIVRAFGRAVYMKIDIEGHDDICFLSVASKVPHLLPKYVSIENASLERLQMFLSAGYTKFKFVSQSAVYKQPSMVPTSGPLAGTESMTQSQHGSGPWGEASADFETRFAWRSASDAQRRLQQGLPIPAGEWYDTIAAM